MATTTERKNQLVWEQLELGAYKQALQLCNRRIKKGEKSEMLLVCALSTGRGQPIVTNTDPRIKALKSFILTHIKTPASVDEATQIARSLSDTTPPAQSVEVVRLLSRVWTNLGPSHAEDRSKLWERAVKSQPQNEELARQWFWGTVRALDWRAAQKAAMTLQKSYTKRREYWFWAVVSSLMLHVCCAFLHSSILFAFLFFFSLFLFIFFYIHIYFLIGLVIRAY